MNRNHTTLAILLIVQVALILLVRSPFSGGTSASESRPLLPMLEALTPMQIELLGNEDRRVTLIKEAGGWQLGDLDGFAIGTKHANPLHTGTTCRPCIRLVSQCPRTNAFIDRWPVWRSTLL